MATIFTDGFDKYGPPCSTIGTANLTAKDVSALLTQREWTTSVDTGINTGVFTIMPGLSETGFALGMISEFGPYLSKTLPNSYGRLIGGFRFLSTLGASGGVAFYDSLNPQVAITVNQLTGLISVWGGTADAGTLLGQSLFSVSANTVHYLNFDVTFAAGMLGSFQVWIDGASVVSGSGATQQIGCNPSANVFQLTTTSAGSGNQAIFVYDDLHLFDNTTSQNNAPVLANPRIESQFPISDHQRQFANNGNTFGITYSNQGTQGQEDNPGANQLFLRPFTPIVNCTVNAIGMIPATLGTNAIANYRPVIYANGAGVPGALLSTGTQVTGTIANVPFVAPLASPQALTAGTQYWIGFICDTAVFLSIENITTVQGYKAVNTYGSGPPGTAPALTANQASWVIFGTCTGAAVNWPSENLNPPFGTASSIISSTVGNEDLYQFPALSTDVVTVYTVAVKAHANVVAFGTRTIDVRTKSNTTDSPGSASGFSPGTSPTWFASYFDLDPNGNIVWTPTAVSNSWSGPKVAS